MVHRTVRRFHFPGAARALLVLSLAACGAPDAGEHGASANSRSARPPIPDRTAVVSGFQRPESARYDSAGDVFFVSNINGDPVARDDNGFVSRVRPDGTIDSLHFIAGGRNGVTLDAPRGLALVGDTLWVVDLTSVRGFDKRTGAPVATIDLAPQHALFLNDIAVGPDGALYITDSGWRIENGTRTHPPGTDRIFRIAPDHSVSVALATDVLERPNGIAWDRSTKRFVIVGSSSAIFAWRPGDAVPKIIGYNSPQMDGVEILPDGRMLVTSHKDSSLTIRSEALQTVVTRMPMAGDLGVDVRRNRVAIPLLDENRLQIWAIPEVKP
jgi:sugar lactone lactonase YvrE